MFRFRLVSFGLKQMQVRFVLVACVFVCVCTNGMIGGFVSDTLVNVHVGAQVA